MIDPLLRGPIIGTMLVCGALSAVGVLTFVRRKTLVGEVVSHAAYPGVILGILLLGAPLGAILGASIAALLALWCVERLRLSQDSALALVLALFFGIGLLLASHAQFIQPQAFRTIQTYLYGQAPSMTDRHIITYAGLALTILTALLLCYKELLFWSFDPTQARLMGRGRGIEALFLGLLILSVMTSLKAVGLILASSMLVAPAVAARQITNRLDRMLIWATAIGMLSGLVGLCLSLFKLPSGPMVALVAVSIALLALFSKLLLRLWRMAGFRHQCFEENILKAIWRSGNMTFDELHARLGGNRLQLRFELWRLRRQGWCTRQIALTPDGAHKAARIVRLHRLWEAYLVNSLGICVQRVHPSAEEVEHILTPEVEARLVQLLRDPMVDPHQQPIPR